MELVHGHEYFLALSSRGVLSILDDSFKFAQASYLVSVEPWSTVRMEQRAFGGILCLLRSDWSLRLLGVCICTDASEKGFAFAVREGCRELASELGRVSERARFKSSSGSIRARSRALPSIAPDDVLDCSCSEEGEVSLARRESRANFLGFVATSGSAAYDGFFREENIIVFEAHSILYPVRYAESSYPPGRLLILSGNLVLVLALCKGRSNKFTLLSVMRRIFPSGFRAGFVLSFMWIPSELDYSDKGSRFFHRDYDSSKSLLHVLAQRSGLLFPSLNHLDDGEVDLVSQVPVPAVIGQTHAPSGDLSGCAGHAAAVSSRRFCVTGKMIASVRCLMVLVLRLLCVGYLLVWLNRNVWMNCRCSGRHLIRVQRIVTHEGL